MRSIRISLIVTFIVFCAGLNGQIFVGGDFGFNSHTNKTKEMGTVTREYSDYSLSLAPEAGKFLSEKVAIGIALGFSVGGSHSVNANETTTKSSSFGINPFVRYYAWKSIKFSIYGEGRTGVEFSRSSRTTGPITDDDPDVTRLSVSIYPGLSYALTEKLELETSLRFLSAGYSYQISKEGTTKNNSSGFNAGAGLSNILSVNGLVIGAIYKF